MPDYVRLRSSDGCLVAPERQRRQRTSRDLFVPGKWRVAVEDHLLQSAANVSGRRPLHAPQQAEQQRWNGCFQVPRSAS